jgi:Flp pilus assembly protein TadG
MRRFRSADSPDAGRNRGRWGVIWADTARSGAVAVEMAMLAPFLATLILGITEIGQVQRAQCYISEAAGAAGATGTLPGSTNAEIIKDARSFLTSCRMTAASAVITIKVNDVVADVSTAARNDKIAVTVAIPVSAISWSGSHFFVLNTSIVSKTVVMLKQG